MSVPLMDLPLYREVGWSSLRTATGRPLPKLPAPGEGWQPCALCWKSGRWYSVDMTSYRLCPACLGLGETSGGER